MSRCLLLAGLLVCLAACRAPRVLDGPAAMDAAVRARVPEAAERSAAVERSRIEALLADGLSLEDALRIALVRNATLRASYEGLSIAHAEVVQAGLPPNPSVDVGLRFVEGGGGEILEAVLVQPLVGWLLAPRRRCVAQARFEATQARLVADALRVLGGVRRAWIDVVAAEQRVGLHRTATVAARGAFEAAQALREAGNVPVIDVRREQAFYEESRVALARAQEEAYAAREMLNLALGLGGGLTAWTVPDRLPDLPDAPGDAGGVERAAVEASRDLAAARGELLALGRELGLTRIGSVLREVAAGVDFEREPDGEISIGPAVAVELPIFDHGQAAVPAARARIRRAQLAYVARAVSVRTHARLAAVRLGAAHRRAHHAETVLLPLRQQVLEETRKLSNAMQIGVFEVLAAKRDVIAAAERHVETLRDYWHARARHDQILAGALPADAMGE